MPTEDVIRPGETIAETDFRGRVFEGEVDFAGCVFEGPADFGHCVFKRPARFTGAVFTAGVSFHSAVFDGFAHFKDVEVTGLARFTGAQFAEGLNTTDLRVDGTLRLDRAAFEVTNLMGPLLATELDLRVTLFQRKVRLEVEADRVVCDRTLFQGGVRLLVGSGDIEITDCELGPAAHLGPRGPGGRRPRLVTLTGTDVSNLTVSAVDLSACAFVNAQNLDRLRMDTTGVFGLAPRVLGAGRRQVISDEVRWRVHASGGHARWRMPPDWPALGPPPGAASRVASAYRSLRKALEEAKDEPGAADFYYGEMEMRRQELKSRRGPAARGERVLLSLYWLTSGYGLRAGRAFLSLLALVGVAALVFDHWGFPAGAPAMNYADSVRFTLRTATSFLRGSEQKLTTTGEWAELVLRFTGPVLFGLFVFALRSRVKR